MLAGSMGMLPSASLAEIHAGHGPPRSGCTSRSTAARRTSPGKGIANPLATILSCAMLLRWSLGLAAEADAVETRGRGGAGRRLSLPRHHDARRQAARTAEMGSRRGAAETRTLTRRDRRLRAIRQRQSRSGTQHALRHGQEGVRAGAASFAAARHRRYPERGRLEQAVHRHRQLLHRHHPRPRPSERVRRGRPRRRCGPRAACRSCSTRSASTTASRWATSGMKYSLPSRELIADSVETMVAAHWFDGMICIPNCDKIVPGMLMAAMRLNVPTIFVSGGPMKAGVTPAGRVVDLIYGLRGGGRVPGRARSTIAGTRTSWRQFALPDVRLVLRHVHGQLDELPVRGARHGAARQRHDPGRGSTRARGTRRRAARPAAVACA